MRRATPAPLRIAMNRAFHGSPRGLIFVMVGTIVAGGATWIGTESALMANQLRGDVAQDVALGMWTNAARMFVLLMRTVLISGSETLLGFAAAAAVLVYVKKPVLPLVRRMQRAALGASVLGALALALQPVSGIAAAIDDAHMRRLNAESHVFALAGEVSRATATRVLAEVLTSAWTPQPGDGPLSLAIKAELHQGSPQYRDVILMRLQRVADGRLRTRLAKE